VKDGGGEDATKLRKFSPGDIVGIFQSAGQVGTTDSADGIIYKVTNEEIVVSFNEMHDFENFRQPLNLALLANQVTYQRSKDALDGVLRISEARHSANQRLLDVLFERDRPQCLAKEELESQYGQDFLAKNFFNDGLNAAQQEAIYKCLGSQDVSMIHGPPGTGKTTTVVEFILQSSRLQKAKILACAPSNIAVDNVIERLHLQNPRLKIVRIGHPARLLDAVQPFCLDALLVKDADYGAQTLGVRKDMNKLQLKLKKATSKSEKKDIYAEYKLLKKDMKQIERVHID